MAPSPVLAKGSLILVTGASSYIASHIVNEALQAGYKVRGTFRTAEKAARSQKILKHEHAYSTVIVADANTKDAYYEAMQGCDAIIHVASNLTLSPDPNEVVQPTVDQVLDILHAAARTPSVKRFVYTSSSTAVQLPHPGKKVVVTANDWNQEALDIALAPPPYTQERAYAVYGASKVKAEQALWRFVEEKKPHFVANAILPDTNFGRVLDSPGATGGFVPALLKGQKPFAPPQHFVDVVDTARLHLIAAVLDETLEKQRIFAFAQRFNWTEIVGIIKEAYPNVTTLYEPEKNELEDLSEVPNELGATLLKKWYGQDGYKTLKQSVLENIESYQA